MKRPVPDVSRARGDLKPLKPPIDYPLAVPLSQFHWSLLPPESGFLVKAKDPKGEPFVVILDVKAHDQLVSHLVQRGRA